MRMKLRSSPLVGGEVISVDQKKRLLVRYKLFETPKRVNNASTKRRSSGTGGAYAAQCDNDDNPGDGSDEMLSFSCS